MDVLTGSDIVAGIRFLLTLPSLLRNPVSFSEASEVLSIRLNNRKTDFLDLVRRAIFSQPQNPYRKLLKNAGCSYEDLCHSVERQGLEETLLSLYREGVFLTVNEFKGRIQVKRGQTVVDVNPSLLKNPHSSQHIQAQSSGSSGRSVPVLINLDYVRDRAVNHRLALESREGRDWIHAVWGIPGNTDIVRILELCAMGKTPKCWFSQVDFRSPELHPRYRWSARVMRWIGRTWGVRIPAPKFVPLEDPSPIIEWAIKARLRGQTPHIITWASPAVRICVKAMELGASLSGVRFSIGGEPVTRSKMETIHRSGATAVPRFMAMECGYVAYGCLHPTEPDDLHLFDDMHAVIQAENRAPGIENPIPPGGLLLSSLRPTAPFVLLNVSLGDQAQQATGQCGCSLEKLGWNKRIRQVRSFERVTTGGMTFLHQDIIDVMERILPGQFGGSMFDYQLVEEESPEGEPKLKIRVNPSLGPLDSQRIKNAFLQGVGSGSGAERAMSLQWKRSGFLAVERAVPEIGPSGKLMPLLKSQL